MRTWAYRFALERGYLDAILTDYVARPFVGLFRWCDRVERRWANFLAGAKPLDPPTPEFSDPEPVPAAEKHT